MKVYRGSFTGNGSSTQTINGGFSASPAVVIVDGAFFRISSHPTGKCSYFANNGANPTTGITDFTATGFIVGSSLNVTSAVHTYVAIVDTGANDIAVGTYVGSGIVDTAITGLAFAPAVVAIKGDAGVYGFWRTTAVGGDATLGFAGFNNQSGLIKTMTADGWTMGTSTSVNGNGTTYYYFALKAVSGLVKVGSYTGNNTDNRYLSGILPQPQTMQVTASKHYNSLMLCLNGGASTPSVISATNTAKKFAGSGSTISFNLNHLPTVGNYLVVGVVLLNGTAPTLVDNQSNTYTQLGTNQNNPVSNIFFFLAKVVTSAGTFTVTLGNWGTSNADVFVQEVAGLDTTTPFFDVNIAALSGTADGSGNAPLPTLTNTRAPSIFFGLIVSDATVTPGQVNAGSGWTIDTTNGRDTTVSQESGMDYKAVASVVGIRPALIFIKSANPAGGFLHNDQEIGDASYSFGSLTEGANAIQLTNNDGFQVGTNAAVNENNTPAYYFVLGTGFFRTQQSLSMKMNVYNHAKLLSMRVNTIKTIAHSLSMKVRVTNPYIRGPLRNLSIRSIDNQKFTKDVLQNQPADALYTNLVALVQRENLNINYVSTVALIDFTSLYPSGFTVSPRTAAAFNQFVCDTWHNAGINVIHRFTSMAMEGKANFPAWPSVTSLPIGTKSDIIPVVFTDDFGRATIGTNWVTNASSGGAWTLNNGKLTLLNAGNEFSYNIAHTAATYVGTSWEASVLKGNFGQDGIIVFGSAKSVSPFFQGFAIYMQDADKIIVEDMGQRNISANTSVILKTQTGLTFVTGHMYKIKVTKTGTTFSVKYWDETNGDSEPVSETFNFVSSLYSSGWFGVSSTGFGKIVKFDNVKITPAQNLNSFLGMVYSWMITNPTSFKRNDIIAPFPEFDTCQNSPNMCYFIANRSWLHTNFGAATVKFFNELKDIEDYAAQQIGVVLKTGYTGPNFTSIQSISDPNKAPPNGNDLDVKDQYGLTMMAKAGIISTDFYGSDFVSLYNPSGLGHPAQEIYDWCHYVAGKYKLPIFFQEWGGFRSMNVLDVSSHDLYFRSVFDEMAALNANVVNFKGQKEFEGLNYYGFADTNNDGDTDLLHAGGSPNYAAATLRVKAQVLRDYYQTGTPTLRTLSMRVRNYITPTQHSISMKVNCVQQTSHGRLKDLTTRSVDLMKWTKDTVRNQISDMSIFNLVEFAYESFNLTHLALCFPMDPISFYPNGYTPSPRPVVDSYRRWVSEIRNRNLKVLHRPVCFAMEGVDGFTRRVGSNIYPAGNPSDVISGFDRNNWLGIMYDFIVNNPNLFADGDIWAPFPERTEGLFDQPTGVHSFLPFDASNASVLQNNYANFFIDVRLVANAAFAAIGYNVRTGCSSDNYSEVRSLWIPQARYNDNRITTFDYYQNYNADGFGKDALSDDLDAAYYGRGNFPIFWQEWGPTPDMIKAINGARTGTILGDPSHGNDGHIVDISAVGLTAHPENRIALYHTVLDTIADKHDQGKLFDFNYWGFWDTGPNDTGLIQITGSRDIIGNYALRPEAVVLQDYFENDVARPAHFPPSPQIPPVSTDPAHPPVNPIGDNDEYYSTKPFEKFIKQ